MARVQSDNVAWDRPRLADPHGQPDKAARVRLMFDRIAPTYERVNRVVSAGRDAYWRRRAVELARIGSADRVLDIACGTGDFARAMADAGAATVVGCDFAGRMLALAAARDPRTIHWCRADALNLPFADGAFTAAGCAFGIRNFQDLAAGLREAWRTLCPGGRLVILEFSLPRSAILRPIYLFYLRRGLPRLAGLISRDRSGAYEYLPASIASFADDRSIERSLREAGFARVEQRPLTWGIVTVHVAWKS